MDRLNAIKLMLIIEQPFFGYLLMHIPFKNDNSIDTIGTDGEKIYYNNKFIEIANDDEIKFLIMHQILHIILNHIIRSLSYSDDKAFNMASDLVVNSLVFEVMEKNQKTNLKNIDTNHLLDGKEAGDWTVDQVYNMIKKNNSNNINDDLQNDNEVIQGFENLENNGDNHSLWKNMANKSNYKLTQIANKWSAYVRNALQYASDKNGFMSGNMKRFIKYMERDKVDWKDVLRNFVETEITDYSFNPPDKRYSEDAFLLPDFNETEDKVTGIFFFIDVSGSMSDEQIAECKAELRTCIKQYNEKVEGYLGYFDYTVSNLKSFDDVESMENIESLGGGGTSFENIFKYLDENEDRFEVEKKKVVIMTDGYAPFPDESKLNVDEVLWIINNNEVTPPFGEVVRI